MYYDGTDWVRRSIGTAGQALTVNATADGFLYADVLTSTLNDGTLLIGNASNIATAQTLSGDATITNAGVLTISNLAVTTAKLAADAVNSAKILDGTIALADLGADSVNSSKIVDSSITSTDILDATITSTDIKNIEG